MSESVAQFSTKAALPSCLSSWLYQRGHAWKVGAWLMRGLPRTSSSCNVAAERAAAASASLAASLARSAFILANSASSSASSSYTCNNTLATAVKSRKHQIKSRLMTLLQRSVTESYELQSSFHTWQVPKIPLAIPATPALAGQRQVNAMLSQVNSSQKAVCQFSMTTYLANWGGGYRQWNATKKRIGSNNVTGQKDPV